MQNAVVHGLRYARKYAISAIAAGFCVVAAKAASVTVSSGTWSAAGVHAGDAVTVTGSCVNDIDGVQLGSLAVSAASETTVEITGAAFSFGAGGLTRTGEGTVKFMTDVHGTGPVALSQGPTYVYGATCGLGDAGSVITISDYKSRLFLGGTVICNSRIRATANYRQDGTTGSNNVFSFFADSLENTVNHIYAELEATTRYAQYIVLYPAAGSKIYLHGGALWASDASNRTLSSRPFASGGAAGAYTLKVDGELIVVDTPITMHRLQNIDMKNGCPLTTVSVAGMAVRDYIGFGQEENTMLSKLVTTVDWAFDASDEASDCAEFTTRDSNRALAGTIDIQGTKQRFGGFYNKVAMNGTITGSVDSVFYCRQWRHDMGTTGVALNIKGAASFVKEGTNSLMLAGAASTTTGDLKVSEGALVLSSAARFANVGSVVVGVAADDEETVVSELAVTPKLSIGAVANFGSSAVLRLNGDGVVEVPSGVQPTFDRIYIDGEEMPAGEYGATACPVMVPEGRRAGVMAHFSGAGKVVAANGATIESKATSWTGGGDGIYWNNSDNWSNGIPGQNDDVTIEIAVYEGPEKEIVNDIAGLTLKSLTLKGAGSFTLSGQSIALLEGGLVSGTDDADATVVTNSVNFGISLAAGQTWSIHGANRELHLLASLDTTSGAYALTRNGSGVWRLYADNYGDGDITLANDDGTTYVYSPNCAFGGAASTLTICGKSIWTANNAGGAKLHLCGTVVSNGVVKFDGYYVRINSGARECWLYSDAANRENVVHGQVQFATPESDSLYLSNPEGQTLVFDGGCSGVKDIVQSQQYNTNPYSYSNTGSLVVTNGAWTINGSLGAESFQCCVGPFTWGAPGSTVGGSIYWHVNQGSSAAITFTSDWTLGLGEATVKVGNFKNRYNNGTQSNRGCPVHFGATKQRIGGFDKNVSEGAYFDGTEGSEFHCYQSSADVTVAAPVNGGLSFIKEGDRRITFTRASDTTGTLGVAGGELILTESATWANCSNVFVSADATLSVSNRAAFAEGLVVALEDGATLDLAYSGTMKASNLTFNGKSAHAGEWGAPGSGAQYTSSMLSGRGTMKVGKLGLVLVFR